MTDAAQRPPDVPPTPIEVPQPALTDGQRSQLDALLDLLASDVQDCPVDETKAIADLDRSPLRSP